VDLGITLIGLIYLLFKMAQIVCLEMVGVINGANVKKTDVIHYKLYYYVVDFVFVKY